jgi:flagellar biosynthesis protein FliR
MLLQDHAQHIGEAVDGCCKSLTTMYSVMLPRNPMPSNFRQLLKTFRMSQRVHLLIKLNLIVVANFALGWMRKWKPQLNFKRMSQSLPPGWTTVRIHMDAMLESARRIISRLLQEDARFFQEYHYLNPFDIDDSEPPAS